MHNNLLRPARARAEVVARRACAIGFAVILATASWQIRSAYAAESTAAAPSALAAHASTTPRQVALNVQGVANAGLTVRVKGIELGEDATILTVSASFASRVTNFTELASKDTFLEDAQGNRLMLKRPDDNRYLKIQDGATMEGHLVFLGAVAPTATQIRLVINQGNRPENTDGPGLTLTLPLVPSAKQ